MHVRSPCSENDISKVWKYDVLKTKAEIAFYSVNIEEKASLALVNLLAKVLAILGWNQRKSMCWVYMIKFEPKGCDEKVWQAIPVPHFPAATPISHLDTISSDNFIWCLSMLHEPVLLDSYFNFSMCIVNYKFSHITFTHSPNIYF